MIVIRPMTKNFKDSLEWPNEIPFHRMRDIWSVIRQNEPLLLWNGWRNKCIHHQDSVEHGNIFGPMGLNWLNKRGDWANELQFYKSLCRIQILSPWHPYFSHISSLLTTLKPPPSTIKHTTSGTSKKHKATIQETPNNRGRFILKGCPYNPGEAPQQTVQLPRQELWLDKDYRGWYSLQKNNMTVFKGSRYEKSTLHVI